MQTNLNHRINESALFLKYKSSYYGACMDCTIHTTIFSLTLYLLWFFKHSMVSLFTIPLLSLMLTKMFVLFHDCLHNSYTPNVYLNYIIAHIAGVFVITSPNWILDHHTHHLTNGNLTNKYKYKFNELVFLTLEQYTHSSPFKQTFLHYFYSPLIYFTYFPVLYFFLLQRFVYIYKKVIFKHKINNTMPQIIFNHVVNNGLIYLWWNCLQTHGILIHYIFSLLFSFIINFLLFFNQHTFNPAYAVDDAQWSQRNSGLVGSSFIQMPSLLKYYSGGIEYHHIHHMNSKIPGYNIHKYHNEVDLNSNMFANVTRLSMRDCYNNLWLMLYDKDNKKYITMQDANACAIKQE